MIISARDNKEAFNEFVNKYRPAIYNYMLKKGFSQHDAEDLTQEVFIEIFDRKVLHKADRQKGKFRSLLLAVSKKVIDERLRKDRAQKRGGGRAVVPIDEMMVAYKKDKEFDKIWVKNLVAMAFETLKEECKRRGLPYYDALRFYVIEKMGYEQIAQKMGGSKQDIKNYIHRGRDKLKEYVRQIIAQYSSSRWEYETEIGYLFKFF